MEEIHRASSIFFSVASANFPADGGSQRVEAGVRAAKRAKQDKKDREANERARGCNLNALRHFDRKPNPPLAPAPLAARFPASPPLLLLLLLRAPPSIATDSNAPPASTRRNAPEFRGGCVGRDKFYLTLSSVADGRRPWKPSSKKSEQEAWEGGTLRSDVGGERRTKEEIAMFSTFLRGDSPGLSI
ncbi:hypothetical protein KM043_004512 [Ampulex compressa]|nr:hypothetical protein KM043_004512 [Ampulex compressa]